MSNKNPPLREIAVEAFCKHRAVSKAAAEEFLNMWHATDPDGCNSFTKAASIREAQALMSKKLHEVIDPVIEGTKR